jgi:hypothetical protein
MPRLILRQDAFSVISLLMSEIVPKKNSSSGLVIVAVLLVVVIVAVASLDDPVLAQTTTTLTLTGSQFDMVGIFEIVYVPCPANVQCNPQYQLAGTDGNSYQLVFIPLECPVGVTCSTVALPNQGERIEVRGTISYNTQGSCMLNGQATPCQPIGTIIVSSWNPATAASTQTTVTLSGSMTSLDGRLSYDGTVYTLTVGPSITPPCCYTSQGCAVPMYLILYQLDFSHVSLKPTSSDNGRLTTVSGTSSNAAGMGQTILVQSWSYYTPPSCVSPSSFPNPPQSLSDVPRFLTQFWAWVSCRVFGHCS